MTVFTYSRVSTIDQDTELQEKELRRAYPDAIHRAETKSGTVLKNREVLNILIEMIGQGDKLGCLEA